MSIRLKTALEFAYIAPALEIIVGIVALFKRDDLGELAKEQREGPFGPDDADSHVMFVQDKNVAVEPRFIFCGNHNQQVTNRP